MLYFIRVQDTFGIRTSRFVVLMTHMEQLLKSVSELILTCVVLHNILMSRYVGHRGGRVDNDNDQLLDGEFGGHYTKPSRDAKDYLKGQFNGEGTF